ncbi:MAG: hypothetical protein JSU81_01540 [Candidatus Coatesbacteria bacterium]|nr:MAG: hypothetical protein JSU81_01540 [Candidatus Coatesbacteria bacterium]
MKARKILTLLLAAGLVGGTTAPAWADDEEEEEKEKKTSDVTSENINFYYGQGENPFGRVSTDEEEEIFYFGTTSAEDSVEVTWSRFQDTTGKASRDIKKIIGVSMVATAATSIAWALLFHKEETRPDNWQKIYEGTGVVPLEEVHTVNLPSVIAGAFLAGGGIWLMQRN